MRRGLGDSATCLFLAPTGQVELSVTVVEIMAPDVVLRNHGQTSNQVHPNHKARTAVGDLVEESYLGITEVFEVHDFKGLLTTGGGDDVVLSPRRKFVSLYL